MEQARKDLTIWEYIAYGVILILLIPYFLGIALADSAQLRDSFFVLIFCTLVIGVRYSVKIKKPVFSYESIGILAFAYLTLFLYKLSVFFLLGALVLSFSAVALLFLDKKDFRLAYAFGTGFFSYCVLFVMSPIFDFPLRLSAALGADRFLGLIGVECKLLALKQEGLPLFLACPAKGDFFVASQCNGLSVLASSLILSLFIAVFSKAKLWKKFLYVAGALGLAYCTNVLRICTIVMLNPVVGAKHYFLMHEIVGYTSIFLTLILIYLTPSLFRKKA